MCLVKGIEGLRICFRLVSDEFEGIRQKQFVRAAAVGAQVAHRGVVGVPQLKDLGARGNAFFLIHAILNAGRGCNSVAWTPSNPTPNHVLPKDIDIQVQCRGIQI